VLEILEVPSGRQKERVGSGDGADSRAEKEEEEEFLNHYKNVLKRHAHTPSGVVGADLKSQAEGAFRTEHASEPTTTVEP